MEKWGNASRHGGGRLTQEEGVLLLLQQEELLDVALHLELRGSYLLLSAGVGARHDLKIAGR